MNMNEIELAKAIALINVATGVWVCKNFNTTGLSFFKTYLGYYLLSLPITIAFINGIRILIEVVR